MRELSPETLRRVCDSDKIGCRSSKDVAPLETIIGQERAVKALEFGLGIKELGFNIYVSGPPGTGRTTAIRHFLERVARYKAAPDDWCYVNDMQDAYRPRAVPLPAGRARVFKDDVQHFIDMVQQEIRKAFESEEYAARVEETVRSMRKQREELFERLNQKAQEEGFTIQSSPMGMLTVPVRDGKPMSDEEFMALEQAEKDAITRKRDQLQFELKATFRQAKGFEKNINEALQKLNKQVALTALEPMIEDLREKYQGLDRVIAYIEAVRNDVLENLALFRADPSQEQQASPFPMPSPKELIQKKYGVNILVDNSELKGGPVVIELNPTYNNLFGRIEKEAQFGALTTDFTMIRAGSLHRANGGFLVLPVEDVLVNMFSYESLKRALRNREINIEDAGERVGFISTKTLQPEPVPLDVKILLIGTSTIYALLNSRDEDFRELFKVKAEFDTRMDRVEKNMKDYAAFVCRVCEEEGLRHLDSTGLAKLIEFGSRLAEDQDKLSTRFGELSDVVREASYYAALEDGASVSADHVKKAIEERFYRSNLIQERIMEAISRDTLMIEVDGDRVGQVNGLAVLGLGDISFGRPNRITVSISTGREGIVDIEREAKLGGPFHTKGVMILSGYLAEKFGQDKPLSLSARLVFEQSYSGVDGDSASSTELYAILSSLSGRAIQQGLAVTGSVNQRGEVQAIGGVNEKIEGFFDVCRAKGLTGRQGVMIPRANEKHLMLKEDVVEAVREGRFHVWSVGHIDEGIEVLTGVKAGARLEDGAFEEGSIHALADQRLRTLSETLKKFAEDKNKNGASSEADRSQAGFLPGAPFPR
ncbi:MAG: AAA family ATPase [Proteobacteria bacterium]|nr:AAA family ATPase [Pseudomonadota bacterium]